MATQQRFEGASIEEVLKRVRAELGADAEIIEANKVRAGGIGGFFAKESYEVLAAPVTGAPRPAATSAAGATSGDPGAAPSLLDLAERVSVAETAGGDDETEEIPRIGGTPPDTGARSALEGPLDRLPSAPASPATSSATDSSRPRSRAEQVAQQVMVERLSRADDTGRGGRTASDADFEPLLPGEMPRISTEGSAFNDVLQRIATDAGPEIADAVTSTLTPVGPMMTARAHAPVPTAADTEARIRAEIRAQIAADAPRDDRGVAAEEPLAQAAALHLASSSDEEARHDEVGAGDGPDGARDDHAEPMDLSPAIPVEAAPERHSGAEQGMSRTERLLSWLAHDHLPRTTLLSALRHLPHMEPLPVTTGVVVAVVGERGRALRLCRQLAKACDADPGEVILASQSYRGSAIPDDRRIVDLTDAAQDRRSWRRRSQPTFVAVESPTGLGSVAQMWTRDVVAALDVHQVIGVVPAARKTEDVAAWAEAVGGVDGLALDRIEETTTPYAVLSLEIPVAYLDDEPATPQSWATVLMERAAA